MFTAAADAKEWGEMRERGGRGREVGEVGKESVRGDSAGGRGSNPMGIPRRGRPSDGDGDGAGVEKLSLLLGKADPIGNGPGGGTEAVEAPAPLPEARAVLSSLSPRPATAVAAPGL